MQIPADYSWVMRGLLKHHKHAKNLIRYLIANGEKAYLWHGMWLGYEPLMYSVFASQNLQFPDDATVSNLIEGDDWNSIVYNLPKFELKCKILNIPIGNELDSDEVVWTPTPTGKFTSK